MRDRQELDHDLLNCLTAILGFAELILEETPPGERRHSDLREIRKAAQAAVGLMGATENGTPQPEGLDAVERNHIVRMLAEVGGNKLAAARRLGISRRTLYRRLERHGLTGLGVRSPIDRPAGVRSAVAGTEMPARDRNQSQT